MKKSFISISISLLISCLSFAQLKYVNPLIGTDGMGHTFPGACVPFGIIQLSPDTDTIPHNINGKYQKDVYKYCAGYQYSDPSIVGFSHSHMSGTGHSDLGDILIMPTNGELRLNSGTKDKPESGYRSRFSHNSEKASAGYYEVMLDDYGIKAQLTATKRVGVHKYSFPKQKEARIILDLNHGIYNYDGKTLWANIRVENDSLITGYRITNGWARTVYTYFAISFSKPIINYGYKDFQKILYKGWWRKFDVNHNFPEMAGRKIVSYFEFDNKDDNQLVIKVALSGVSTEGAIKNLKAEAENKSFDILLKEAQNSWKKELSSIKIEGNDDQKTMFYTSLYHSMINPSIYMDVDKKYRGLDGNIHQATDFNNYTIFSLWDTYRAEHPLLMLIKPKEAQDMVKSMLKHQEQSVHHLLPIWSHMANDNWCMSGYHACSVIADAIEKNAKINLDTALNAMVTTSNVSYFDGIGDYLKLDYVPFDKQRTAASTTLEYAYDDWTIYKLAEKSNNKELADQYYKRALNYRNIFDPKLGFARPKYSNGKFKEPFDVLQTHGEGFIEGNSWNFSFHVPHDVFGLMKIMGGEKIFRKRLDRLFTMPLPEKYYKDNEDITEECLIGGYVHGNEPSHHIPYLYAWTKTPWKSQKIIREVLQKMYKNHIRGLGGNDDCGQMSSWYIFSAMGFYPVCPGTDQYVLGTPYLPYVKIDLGNNKSFEIKADKVSDKFCYIKKVKLNGKTYSKLYIEHKDIMQGGCLEFIMSDKPNKKRGLSTKDKPYSLTK